RRTGAGVETLDPDGVWRRASRHTETIEVAGEEPVEVEVIETARGPVIIGGPEGIDGDPACLAYDGDPADLAYDGGKADHTDAAASADHPDRAGLADA
ncbi:penicillin acylase family protein, partial [Streptomyces sp. WAC04114]|uniref:penicillin acylase family protein n=1 Tax=Streptomyces sp. WAC04114 TaxID=2867961 RepID=UPI001C8CBED4